MQTAMTVERHARFNQISKVIALFSLATGLVVIFGWIFEIAFLTTLLPPFPAIKFNSALSFFFAGASLWLLNQKDRPAADVAGRVCAAIVVLLGLWTLSQYALGMDLGIDELFVADRTGEGLFAGRSSVPGALNLLLLGSALLLMDVKVAHQRPTEWLVLVAAFDAFLSFLGYTYNIAQLYSPVTSAPFALQNIIFMELTLLGVLLARPTGVVVSRVTASDASGLLMRRVLPMAILFPPFVGWLGLIGQQAGLYQTNMGVAIVATATIAVFVFVIAATGQEVGWADRQRAHAEAAIRESQEMLQAIMDNTSAVIYVKDLDGRYVMVNRRYSELFHVDGPAVIGKTDADLFPKELADAYRAMDQRVAAAGYPLTEEEVAPHDDGLHTYISIKCPLRGSDGSVQGVFGISSDITQVKRAEQKFQAQVARLNLLGQITVAIGERHDLRSIHQVVLRSLEERLSAEFCATCDYNSGEQGLVLAHLGPHSRDIGTALGLNEGVRIPIDRNGLWQCVTGRLVHEPDIRASQFPFAQLLAQQRLHSLVLAPLQFESSIFGILIVARREANAFSSADCEFLRQLSEHVALATNQARLYTALQQAYNDLRQSQQAVVHQERMRALGQMASGIAHDINNALSPVALYIDSLLDREAQLSPQGREQLGIAQRALEDVGQTISRMREFYTQRERAPQLGPVNLNNCVQQVVDLTRARWRDLPQQRGIVIGLQLELRASMATVTGIEGEIRDALTNLVFNAVDAMPDGGVLAVRTGNHGGATPDQVWLEIGDSGIGMDEDTRRRCLEPFFTTKGDRGSGLGLAMVYGMARRHGADLDIESAPGDGTTVRLTFPAASAPLQLGATPSAVQRPIQRLRILIVDDDPMLLKSLHETLTSDGHAITVSEGGQAGIDAFHAALGRGEPFAAVITDLGMPYVDGHKVAASIRAASPSTPIILLTGWGQRLLGTNEIPPNVDKVLAKPPKLRELRAALLELSSP